MERGSHQSDHLRRSVDGGVSLWLRQLQLHQMPRRTLATTGQIIFGKTTRRNRIKITSGGQTGVDRAALDFAIRHGYEHGGWCPHDRRAEDGVIPPIYRLRETDSVDYDERTERNVVDSDATLIVARGKKLFGGTALTKDLAGRYGHPVLVVRERDGVSPGAVALSEFL